MSLLLIFRYLAILTNCSFFNICSTVLAKIYMEGKPEIINTNKGNNICLKTSLKYPCRPKFIPGEYAPVGGNNLSLYAITI